LLQAERQASNPDVAQTVAQHNATAYVITPDREKYFLMREPLRPSGGKTRVLTFVFQARSYLGEPASYAAPIMMFS
jgi:hypothetical protein